ncbi:MAG: PqqD family protein [Thermoplasmata archaeon]
MDFKDLNPKMKMLLSSKPERNEEVDWVEENDNIVLVYPKNFTRFEKFLHRHLGGPENIRRPLDDKGTFIWKMCDGGHNVHEICQASHMQFKEDIEPVMRRVVGFLEMLLKLNLITFNVPDRKEQEKEEQEKEEQEKEEQEKEEQENKELEKEKDKEDKGENNGEGKE